ncbi:MAG: hypothetical protein OXC92_00965 [Flavobacteriaceae bacterium]|nr:hypothetical protein [Flavobacteriaceae bacterium]MCY4298346.1 hypothetical protein [Flavobacteriaceae bacterium]MCY4298694.1 hypothetical protein [Flavobacteriaceae bacterium]
MKRSLRPKPIKIKKPKLPPNDIPKEVHLEVEKFAKALKFPNFSKKESSVDPQRGRTI